METGVANLSDLSKASLAFNTLDKMDKTANTPDFYVPTWQEADAISWLYETNFRNDPKAREDIRRQCRMVIHEHTFYEFRQRGYYIKCTGLSWIFKGQRCLGTEYI